MVFYDDPDKQHFRQSCCQEPYFCQFTDNEHFPSFQLFTNSALPAPIGIAWRIFDLEDNDLGAWPGFPVMDTYHFTDNGYQFVH